MATHPDQSFPPDPSSAATPFLGLRTVVYFVDDLARGRDWYSRIFGIQPYFDELYYVGFDVGGYELGLQPATDDSTSGRGGSVAYWGVENIDRAMKRVEDLGARPFEAIQEVGEGIRVGSIRDPFGNVVGLIENPHFRVRERG